MKRTPWVTWRLFLLTFPVDIFAVVFLSGRTHISQQNIHLLALLASLAHLMTTPFFIFGTQISRRLNNWKADILILVFLGTVRGYTIFVFGNRMEIPNTVIDEFRILNSAVVFPTWFIFFALVAEAKHQYQKEFDEIFRQVAIQVQARNQTQELSGDNTPNVGAFIARLQSATSTLGNEIKQAINQNEAKTDYAFESRKIQELIDKEIRPTSRSLWNIGSFSAPAVRTADLIHMTLLEQKLLVNFALLFSTPLLFVGVAGGYGIKAAIIQTISTNLPVVVSYFLVEEFTKRKLLMRNMSNLLILGLSWLIPVTLQFSVVPQAMRITEYLPNFLLYQTALWIVLVSTLIGSSLIYSIRVQRHAVLRSLKALTENEKYLEFISSEFNPVRDMELSRYLHGEVQSGLTASVLLLQQASKNGDAILGRKALENAVKILTQNLAEGYERTLNSIEIHLAQIVSGWRGIADIEMNLNFLSSISPDKTRDVIELIGEGVANAIRHGKATKILITDHEESAVIRVNIDSNARSAPQGKAGIGTDMFNRLTQDWNFESDEAQSRLTLTFPKI